MAARHGSDLAPCHERQYACHSRGVRRRHGLLLALSPLLYSGEATESGARVQMTPVVLRLMWQPQCLLPRPNSPRSQCRGFFFAGAVVAKEADILST